MEPVRQVTIRDCMSDPDVHAVFAALSAPGDPHPAVLFVGGCVRNLLLGRPANDVDLATVHPPERVIERLEAAGIAYLTMGIDHGTVTAHFGPKRYEITTLRIDVETFGRHARVAYTDDWVADASRRDFTINALYADTGGNIYDPLGGIDDVAAGRVRFIGDPHARIAEDALRILRFFRFHAQLGETELDPAGRAACRDHRDMLANLSGERIRDELFKLLAAEGAPATLWQLVESGVLAAALPELTGLGETAHDDNLICLSVLEELRDKIDPLRRLALLIQTPDVANAVGERMRLSNDDRKRLVRMVSATSISPLESFRYSKPPASELKFYRKESWFDTGLLDLILRRKTRRGWLRVTNARTRKEYLEELTHEHRVQLYNLGPETWRDRVLLSWAFTWGDGISVNSDEWSALLAASERWPVPEFPLQGADVVAAGVPEGPEVGRLLDAVEEWWVDGDFEADREACVAELARRVG
jgi:poly(A) polymerase